MQILNILYATYTTFLKYQRRARLETELKKFQADIAKNIQAIQSKIQEIREKCFSGWRRT